MRPLVALLALGLLVALHEVGHYIGARLLGIRVERLKIGLGPPLFSWHWGDTEFILGLLPLGASVRVGGGNPHAPFRREGDLLGQPVWRRMLFMASGPLANYLVALVAATVLYLGGTHVPVPLTLGSVEPGSAAARAGLRPGDVVESIRGRRVSSWSELVDEVAANPGVAVELAVRRTSGVDVLRVEPRADTEGQGRLGVGQQYTFRRSGFFEALGQALGHTRALAVEGLSLAGRLIRGDPAPGAGGPTELFRQSDRGADGWARMGIGLSVALALFYLLPFPSLDGGRMMLLALEAYRKRPLEPRIETLLHALFYALLLMGAGWLALRAGRL